MGGGNAGMFNNVMSFGTTGFLKKQWDKYVAPPELPKNPNREAEVSAGDEGIRSGEMAKESKRRAIGSAYLTQGQTRGTEPLGISGRQTLG